MSLTRTGTRRVPGVDRLTSSRYIGYTEDYQGTALTHNVPIPAGASVGNTIVAIGLDNRTGSMTVTFPSGWAKSVVGTSPWQIGGWATAGTLTQTMVTNGYFTITNANSWPLYYYVYAFHSVGAIVDADLSTSVGTWGTAGPQTFTAPAKASVVEGDAVFDWMGQWSANQTYLSWSSAQRIGASGYNAIAGISMVAPGVTTQPARTGTIVVYTTSSNWRSWVIRLPKVA